jgi:hypothetical protein
MIDTRKPYRQFDRKDEYGGGEDRVTVGLNYGNDTRLIVESSHKGRVERYRSDSKLEIHPCWRDDGSVLIELSVTNYSRNGARRTSYQSLVLPRDAADAIAKVLNNRPANEALAEMPNTTKIER